MLKDFLNSCKIEASFLDKAYTEYSIDELANNYVNAQENKDDLLAESYLAALILRHAFLIKKYSEKPAKNYLNYTTEDVVDWLITSLNLTLEEKSWNQKGYRFTTLLSNKIEYRCYQQKIYESKLQRNRLNYDNISLDTTVPDKDGEDKCLLDIIPAENSDYLSAEKQYSKVDYIVQDLLDKNKIIEAIICDTIAYNNCEKVKNTVVKETLSDNSVIKKKNCTRSLSKLTCAKLIRNFTSTKFTKEFTARYSSVSKNKIKTILSWIKKCSNKEIYSYIDATKNLVQNNYTKFMKGDY
jgi:hypothetical protein